MSNVSFARIMYGYGANEGVASSPSVAARPELAALGAPSNSSLLEGLFRRAWSAITSEKFAATKQS
jgi:hypothetical protein